MQGVMMLPASALPAQGAEFVYKRLWVHEVFRVFYDRLVDDNDRLWLLQQVSLCCCTLMTATAAQLPAHCYTACTAHGSCGQLFS